MSLVFDFDVSRCSGCMACVVACLDQNDLSLAGEAFRRVTRSENDARTLGKISFLSLSCFHCGDAPCLPACPTGAIFRHEDNGIVDIKRELCVGCHSCALACPFGAPRFFPDGKMMKCDLCGDRVEHGLEPACIRVCSTRALKLTPLGDLSDRKFNAAAQRLFESLRKP